MSRITSPRRNVGSTAKTNQVTRPGTRRVDTTASGRRQPPGPSSVSVSSSPEISEHPANVTLGHCRRAMTIFSRVVDYIFFGSNQQLVNS